MAKGYYVSKWGKIVPLKRSTTKPKVEKPVKALPNAGPYHLFKYICDTAAPPDMFEDYYTPMRCALARHWRSGNLMPERAHKVFTRRVAESRAEYMVLHPSTKFGYGDMKAVAQMLADQFLSDLDAQRWDRLGVAVRAVALQIEEETV